jgi:hypothetical protein
VSGPLATVADALDFVRAHGVVLVAARGAAPRLTEAIVGAPIRGSWWAHPRSHHIHALLEGVTASKEVLVCRLLDGKVTLVHRRLWPALVRLAARFTPHQLAELHDEHTPSGRHVRREVAYPGWVPAEANREADALTEQAAIAALGV